jgi:hypothetical protein
MISFPRPVALTAARTSGCDQACVDVRSTGRDLRKGRADVLEEGIDGKSPVNLGKVSGRL